MVVAVLIVASIQVRCPGAQSNGSLGHSHSRIADIPDYARPESDTYLSYPEWYIVWSYQEKAAYQKSHLPSGFPYFHAIGQYWSDYCGVNRLVQGRYDFDFGAHLMLVVIGTSFTAEYALKSLYENTVGRFTEWLGWNEPTDEDIYAAQVAQRYADFVLVRPFYEYSFTRELTGLWGGTSLFGGGRHLARKWERKVFLTYDYAVEAFYCQLIEWATHLTFGVAGSDTYASIANASDSLLRRYPHITHVEPLPDERGAFVVDIPRYQEFTATAVGLAQQGVRFHDIAGNDEIAVSVLTAQETLNLTGAEPLLSSVVVIDRARQRLLVRVPVPSLHTFLIAAPRAGLEIEHIYDY